VLSNSGYKALSAAKTGTKTKSTGDERNRSSRIFTPGIRETMTDAGKERELGRDSRHPNFILVVLLSAVALILIFIGSYILIAGKGKKIIPPKQRDTHPTSCLTLPDASRQYV
jgi:hypothetical protein